MTPSQAAQEEPTSPLTRYGAHDMDCRRRGGADRYWDQYPCSCGLDAAIEAEAAAATPSLDRNLLAEAIFESGVRQTMSQSEQAADNILAEIPIILARLDAASATPNGERR